jgi:uncharacterized protein YdeI (BOF family)
MKKILAILIAFAVAMPALALDKKSTVKPAEKTVKKHKKFDGTLVSSDQTTKKSIKKK